MTVEQSLPWAGEIPELRDEIAGEKMPAALMTPVLEPRRVQHEQQRAAAAAKAIAIVRVAELQPRIAQLTDRELGELEQAGRLAYGEYTTRAHDLRAKVRARRNALAATTPHARVDDDTAATVEASSTARDHTESAGDPDDTTPEALTAGAEDHDDKPRAKVSGATAEHELDEDLDADRAGDVDEDLGRDDIEG